MSGDDLFFSEKPAKGPKTSYNSNNSKERVSSLAEQAGLYGFKIDTDASKTKHVIERRASALSSADGRISAFSVVSSPRPDGRFSALSGASSPRPDGRFSALSVNPGSFRDSSDDSPDNSEDESDNGNYLGYESDNMNDSECESTDGEIAKLGLANIILGDTEAIKARPSSRSASESGKACSLLKPLPISASSDSFDTSSTPGAAAPKARR